MSGALLAAAALVGLSLLAALCQLPRPEEDAREAE